jgi:Holliday junction resolvase
MPIGTGYGSSGVPDFLACKNGLFIGIEAKAGKGKTTALQEDNMRRIRESGGTTIVVNENNLTELEELLCKKDER